VTVYLDASAIVKLVAPEAETEPLLAFLGERPSQATSVVGLVEVRRAAARRAGVSSERVDAVLTRVTAIALDRGVVDLAGAIGTPTLRTLDAIHLASAAVLADDLEALVTYDRRLAEAAAAAGLPTASPGEPLGA
jgi:predicted nucleic acid-binding protein